MRAIALDLFRVRDDDADLDTGIFSIPAVPPRPKRSLTFSERGYSFIPLVASHLELFAFLYGRNVPRIEECTGRVMVDAGGLPLGTVIVWIEQDQAYLSWSNAGEIATYCDFGAWNAGGIGNYYKPGKNWLYADFGRWLKIFPKDILRAMHEVADRLRKHEMYILHASADESVPGSDYLLTWLGAKPTGDYADDGNGPLYRLDLRECKI